MLLFLAFVAQGFADFSNCFLDNSTLQIDLQNNTFTLQLWKRRPYVGNLVNANSQSEAPDPFRIVDDSCLVYSKGFNVTLSNEHLSMTTTYPKAPSNVVTLTFKCPYDRLTCRGLSSQIISFKYTITLHFSNTNIRTAKNVESVFITSFNHSSCWNNPYLIYNINPDYDLIYLCVIVQPMLCTFPERLTITSAQATISIFANNSQTNGLIFPVTAVPNKNNGNDTTSNKIGKLPVDSMFSLPYDHMKTTHFCHVCSLLISEEDQKNCVSRIVMLSQSNNLATGLVYMASYRYDNVWLSTDIYANTTSYKTARYGQCFLEPQVWLYPDSVQIQLTPSPIRNPSDCANPIGMSSTQMMIGLSNQNNFSETIEKTVPLAAFSWEKNTYWLFCSTRECYELLNKAMTNSIRLKVMEYISFRSSSDEILDTVVISSNTQNITCLNTIRILIYDRSLNVLFNLNSRSCLPLQDTLSQRPFYRITFYEHEGGDVATQNFTMKGRMTRTINGYTVGNPISMDCSNIDVTMTTMTCKELFTWMRRTAKRKKLIATIIYGDFTYTITRIYYNGYGFLIGLTVSMAVIFGISSAVYTYFSIRRFVRVVNKLES